MHISQTTFVPTLVPSRITTITRYWKLKVKACSKQTILQNENLRGSQSLTLTEKKKIKICSWDLQNFFFQIIIGMQHNLYRQFDILRKLQLSIQISFYCFRHLTFIKNKELHVLYYNFWLVLNLKLHPFVPFIYQITRKLNFSDVKGTHNDSHEMGKEKRI